MTDEEMRSFATTVIEGLEQIAADHRNEHRTEVPMTVHFIRFPEGTDSPPEVLAMTPHHLGGTDKEQLAMNIREMFHRSNARYVILMNEAWVSCGSSEDEQRAVAAWTAAGNSLEHFPGRSEVLMATIDGPDLNLMLSRPILSDGSVGEQQRMGGVCTGRLANLSSQNNPEQPQVWN